MVPIKSLKSKAMIPLHIRTGTFMIDKDAARQKLWNERMLVWRHRFWLVWGEVGAVIFGTLYLLAWGVAGWRTEVYNSDGMLWPPIAAAIAFVFFGLFLGVIVLTIWAISKPEIKLRIDRIRDQWNPPSLSSRLDP